MGKSRSQTNYDGIVEKYLRDRDKLKSGKYVRKLLKLLPPLSSILDLGCGAGVPVDRELIQAGHQVTGIDLSAEMIERARSSCQGGQFEVRDMGNLGRGEYRVEAVISLYAMFHVPRTKQLELLKVVSSYLPSGGLLLMTMGDKDFEGTTDYLGQQMWWSQWGPLKNREMVKKAGFDIILDEIDRGGGEEHQVIMARKV